VNLYTGDEITPIDADSVGPGIPNFLYPILKLRRISPFDRSKLLPLLGGRIVACCGKKPSGGTRQNGKPMPDSDAYADGKFRLRNGHNHHPLMRVQPRYRRRQLEFIRNLVEFRLRIGLGKIYIESTPRERNQPKAYRAAPVVRVDYNQVLKFERANDMVTRTWNDADLSGDRVDAERDVASRQKAQDCHRPVHGWCPGEWHLYAILLGGLSLHGTNF